MDEGKASNFDIAVTARIINLNFDTLNFLEPMIKSKLLQLIVISSFLLSMISCNSDEEWKSDVHELKFEMSGETAMLGEGFKFTDLSLGITTRTWTFEDGIPETSNDPTVTVQFTKPGTKKCTLTLVYDNGTVETKDFTIEVLQPLTGVMNVETLSPMGCVAINAATEFSVDAEGEPTSYTWTFPGGTPATSTAANPTVSWSKRGFVTVQVEMTRESDNATTSLEKQIYVGNYPMLVPYTVADMDSWAFDAGTKIGKWTAWSTVDEVTLGKAVRAAGGADGTANCIQFNYNKANIVWQLFTRDNWVNNAHLEKGKKYEFIFWMKGDANFTVSEVILINNLPDWSWNELLQAHSKNNWSQYFPDIPFEVQNETRLFYAANLAITTSWQQFRYEVTIGDKDIQNITLPNVLLNTYPFFVINSAAPDKIYIDEIQINLIEE